MGNPLFEPRTSPLNTEQDCIPVCSKCQQALGEGQMVSWEAGSASHVTCPPHQRQNQDQWQSPILNPKLPQEHGQQPQQLTGQHPEVQQPTRQYSSRKSAVANIPWDVFLNGRWINRVYTEPDIAIEMVKQSLVNHDAYNPAIQVQPGTIAAPSSVPLNRNRMGPLEKIGSRKKMKYGETRPSHAFAVPSATSNAVAMALAEEGMKGFEVAMDDDIGASYFSFPTSAEKEVATDIVAEKFAPQVLLW